MGGRESWSGHRDDMDPNKHPGPLMFCLESVLQLRAVSFFMNLETRNLVHVPQLHPLRNLTQPRLFVRLPLPPMTTGFNPRGIVHFHHHLPYLFFQSNHQFPQFLQFKNIQPSKSPEAGSSLGNHSCHIESSLAQSGNQSGCQLRLPLSSSRPPDDLPYRLIQRALTPS